MKVVVATGTRPVMPHAFADLGAWTSDDVFTMETVPESITIVGGGYIACELAWFFASVGVKTKMLVRGDVLLRAEDQSIRPLFREGFCEEVDVSFQTKIETASFADGQFTIDVETISEGGELVKSTLTSEKLLFAIGRESTADAINGEAAGVALDESGFVQTDEFLRTSAEEVFALGDVAGRHLFTHSAAWEAIYLGDCWLEGKTEELDYGPMPHAVFSYPEVAGVGKTEQELVNEGISYTKGSVEYTSAAKGRAVKEKHGLCKFLLDAESGEILGCHIVGHQAATLIHQVLAAMKWRNHIRSLTEMIYIHPSLAEVVRNAARVAKKNWEAAQEKR
ncbi:MAG: FAD-dependent oxidoreductase [Verrucomicrobiota bacterium]